MISIASSAAINPQAQRSIGPASAAAAPREESAAATGRGIYASESGEARKPNRSEAVAENYTSEEQREITELAARDREVRAHEAAHANVGGVYAGSPSYSYARGPDGNNYAVGGEVSIDVNPVPGDPRATIAKAQSVRRAALAPADPSAQDRSVASAAVALEQAARQELQQQNQNQRVDTVLSSVRSGPAIFEQIAGAEPAEPGTFVSERV